MQKTKSMCDGCYNNYYNQTRDDGCWSFANAQIVKRVEVGTWEPPPYSKSRAKHVLSCFNRQGSSMLPLSDERVK